jgi:hypothetical protein
MVKSTNKNTLLNAIRGDFGAKRFLFGLVKSATRKASVAMFAAALLVVSPVFADETDRFDDSLPLWTLLLGGKTFQPASPAGMEPQTSPAEIPSGIDNGSSGKKSAGETSHRVNQPNLAPPQTDDGLVYSKPVLSACRNSSILIDPLGELSLSYCSASFRSLTVKNIPPLYRAPELPGEGVWRSQGLPTGPDGQAVMYRTSYRPSVEYPNAIAHMLLFDMSRLSMRLYIGSTEPGGSAATATIEPEARSLLLAVTNALWKQKHSGEAGAIFRGKVIKPLFPGMATMVVYNDDSVDVLEWNEGIPTSIIRDARQLRHLIVKDGKVVDTVLKGGKPSDGEIGLGFLLSEEQVPAQFQYWWGGYGGGSPTVNYGPDWFIATRSAFGVRKDGNLVFAAGHHISTKDLAKAMVLAGCDRAIHADANPHNVLGNLYYPNGDGSVTKKAKLSPEQKDTLNRYDRSYTSDFFAFFLKRDERNSSL